MTDTPMWGRDQMMAACLAKPGSAEDEELLDLIDHSYDLVVARLTRAQRSRLEGGGSLGRERHADDD
jgi:hypothetical protein